MFKLITEQEEEKLMREYSIRRYVVMVSALSLVLGIGIVGLLPSYLLSKARQGEALERARVDSLLSDPEQVDSLEWLARINQRVDLLSPNTEADDLYTLIEAVVRAKISGISIVNFTWATDARNTSAGNTLSVSGIARDRQALIGFEEAINDLELFSNVALPLSNLTKDRDIDFTLNLTVI